MAPMIDLVFLLLVFFMCVSSVAEAQRAVEVSLPEAEKAKQVARDDAVRWVVTVDAQGGLHLGAEAVASESLGGRLGPGLRERPDGVVVIRADEQVSFEQTQKALRAAAEAGAVSIRMGALLASTGGGEGR